MDDVEEDLAHVRTTIADKLDNIETALLHQHECFERKLGEHAVHAERQANMLAEVIDARKAFRSWLLTVASGLLIGVLVLLLQEWRKASQPRYDPAQLKQVIEDVLQTQGGKP